MPRLQTGQVAGGLSAHQGLTMSCSWNITSHQYPEPCQPAATHRHRPWLPVHSRPGRLHRPAAANRHCRHRCCCQPARRTGFEGRCCQTHNIDHHSWFHQQRSTSRSRTAAWAHRRWHHTELILPLHIGLPGKFPPADSSHCHRGWQLKGNRRCWCMCCQEGRPLDHRGLIRQLCIGLPSTPCHHHSTRLRIS